MNAPNYKRTKLACYAAYFTMASIFCLPPLLFVTFHTLYDISYTLLGTLVLTNFCTQLGIDLLFTFFAKRFPIGKVVRVMPLITSFGLFIYALIPSLFPQYAYIGLLIGTVLTSFFSCIQNTLVRAMDPNEYETLLTTLVASFSNVNDQVIVLAAVLMVGVCVGLRKELMVLDVITLGKDQAINLGVDYDRTIRKLLLGVVLLISVATALVGPISFMGLIVANLSRQLFKTYRHRELILGSALIGMVLLIFGQLIVEQVFSYGIPISVFITVGGGLYFLYLLLAQGRRTRR